MSTPRFAHRFAVGLMLTPLILASCGEDESTEQLDVGGPASFQSSLCGRTLSIPDATMVGDIELGCTGMNVGLTGRIATSLTTVVTPGGDITGASAPLCSIYMVPPLDEPMTELGMSLEDFETSGAAGILATWEGSSWSTTDGCVKWDSYASTRGVGSYEAIALGPDGQAVRIHGNIDFCAYGYRDDCPHSFYDEDAAEELKQVEISAPLMGEDVKAAAGDCRVLIDPVTSGMQVDMEIAIYEGQHVSQIYQGACGEVQVAPPPASFVFRSAGVTGPGSYGPTQSVMGSQYRLPGFELRVPKTWFASNTIQACTVVNTTVLGETTDDSVCEFTVDDTNGRFELTCTNAVFAGEQVGTILPPSEKYEGDFSISMDCDVRTR